MNKLRIFYNLSQDNESRWKEDVKREFSILWIMLKWDFVFFLFPSTIKDIDLEGNIREHDVCVKCHFEAQQPLLTFNLIQIRKPERQIESTKQMFTWKQSKILTK